MQQPGSGRSDLFSYGKSRVPPVFCADYRRPEPDEP
jgi:hypothetical protein